MSSRPLIRRLAPLAALAVLAGCGDPGGGDYPRLLPLSQLNAPPAVPAHAAEAAADPSAVETSLRARQAAARRHAPESPVTGDAALAARAAALRARAGALAATDPAAAAPTPATETDPETAARAEALRQRARDMLNPGAAGDLPPCPPGTADPQAAGCAPD
ncbi:hypothetical protein [Paracoccus sp. SJTW-4]|uniref:hypothetical protein n=1 Tax=Paracoccus sp. SJTW-4 TaxID=3078428 RepID=UPI0039EC5BCD